MWAVVVYYCDGITRVHSIFRKCDKIIVATATKTHSPPNVNYSMNLQILCRLKESNLENAHTRLIFVLLEYSNTRIYFQII